jgi:hypothetical protein
MGQYISRHPQGTYGALYLTPSSRHLWGIISHAILKAPMGHYISRHPQGTYAAQYFTPSSRHLWGIISHTILKAPMGQYISRHPQGTYGALYLVEAKQSNSLASAKHYKVIVWLQPNIKK